MGVPGSISAAPTHAGDLKSVGRTARRSVVAPSFRSKRDTRRIHRHCLPGNPTSISGEDDTVQIIITGELVEAVTGEPAHATPPQLGGTSAASHRRGSSRLREM
jgi:hypothetical protein